MVASGYNNIVGKQQQLQMGVHVDLRGGRGVNKNLKLESEG